MILLDSIQELLAHELDVLLLELLPDVLVVHLRLLPTQLPGLLLVHGQGQLRVWGARSARTWNVIKTGVLELGYNTEIRFQAFKIANYINLCLPA